MAEVRKSYSLRENQAVASHPARHAWVSASAGTGKTQVLTARVLRLLLNGADPAGILCITFTKAGAAEMAERLNNTLARWVRCPDKELRLHLSNLGEATSDETIAHARTLFARVLEAPGGLKIETIHAFAQSLLAAFPLESGVTPGFEALDERSTQVMRRRIITQVLVTAERSGDPILQDFQAISVRQGDGSGLTDMIDRMTAHADAFATIRSREEIEPKLRALFDLPLDTDTAMMNACRDDVFDIVGLREFALALGADKGAQAQARADTLARWLGMEPAQRAADLELLFAGFLTKKYTPLARMATAGMKKADPSIEDLGARLAETCLALVDFRDRIGLVDWLGATLRVGWQVSLAYRQEKERHGVIDYGDMIDRAARLLSSEGMGAWVRYKLDQKLDHLLIDEAQDTNAEQWTIARSLTDEFFAGEGARDAKRTIFAVGDFKQAIFSFQGTDPREFEAARQWFDRAIREGGQTLQDLDLAYSFRSTEAVLTIVNQIIAEKGAAALGLERDVPDHVTNRKNDAGRVILLSPTVAEQGTGGDDEPVIEAGDIAGEEEWARDVDRAHATKLARQIAAWLNPEDPLWLEDKARALRPDDVLVLLRSRGEFASMLVARLHEEGVPVAGVDRLRLTAPLPVQDLLALIRFALQPEDDLTLAVLLVSPLLGWTQDQLFALAHKRKSSLWRALRQSAESDSASRQAVDWLAKILSMADFAAPYEFLETILSGPLDGRRLILARLGEEARDPLDELLNAAFAFETANLPSLQGFLDWIEREDVDVKRDPSAPRDAVRLMTVHGSKGLEAPLVILADATKDPDSKSPGHTMMALEDGGPLLPFHSSAKRARGVLAEAFERDAIRSRQEHWRLGYVALTRAQDILVVTGMLGLRAAGVPPAESWYAGVESVMTTLGAEEAADSLWGRRLEYRSGTARRTSAQQPVVLPRPVLPDWARLNPPPEQAPPRPLAPSAIAPDDVTDPPFAPSDGGAARRGILLHALFERLPAVAADKRRQLAEEWLAKPGREPDAERRAEMVDAVMRVLEAPQYSDIFSSTALAEAPVAAVVGSRVIAGTVDRLLVSDDVVRLVDFKTGRQAPQDVSRVPIYHLKQMSAYVAALECVFPGRRIEASLLYTAGPRLIILPDDVVEQYRPVASEAIGL